MSGGLSVLPMLGIGSFVSEVKIQKEISLFFFLKEYHIKPSRTRLNLIKPLGAYLSA
jgi:hypothetical protein